MSARIIYCSWSGSTTCFRSLSHYIHPDFFNIPPIFFSLGGTNNQNTISLPNAGMEVCEALLTVPAGGLSSEASGPPEERFSAIWRELLCDWNSLQRIAICCVADSDTVADSPVTVGDCPLFLGWIPLTRILLRFRRWHFFTFDVPYSYMAILSCPFESMT